MTGQQPAGPGADRARADGAQVEGGTTAQRADRGGQPEQAASSTPEEVAELQARLQRAAADLDNLRKRYARELERERRAERNRVAAAFLPVLDNLELALAHAEANPAAIIEGVRHVADQAVGVLAGLGYPRQDDTGVPFDPNRHEVVRVVDDPEADPGTVVDVLRPGYGAGQAQLRPAAVAVAQRVG
jgi:molecular chaperone GrpE